MNNNRQLLCTFSSVKFLNECLDELKNNYSIYNNKFFIFVNKNSTDELFITYNILKKDDVFQNYPNTISVHRKKETNTIFTLNSINQLIKKENNGILDKKFPIKWQLYKNSLIITNKSEIKVIPMELLRII